MNKKLGFTDNYDGSIIGSTSSTNLDYSSNKMGVNFKPRYNISPLKNTAIDVHGLSS